MNTTGSRVHWLRKTHLNMTLVDFGTRIGITASSVSTIENGKSNPSDQTIRAIYREFGVDEMWLRTGEGEPFAKKPRSEAIAEYVGQITSGTRSETEMLLIELMAETSVEEWTALADFFRHLAAKMNKPGTD